MKTSLRKSKKLIAFLAVCCMIFYLMPTAAFGAAASDISGHWAQDKIQSYLDAGLTTGYSDGTFKPDNYITRAEFVTLVNKVFGYTGVAPINYSDVSQGAWYANDIAIAEAAGYITGYPGNTFRPESPITRAEAAMILMKINNLAANPQGASNFTDIATLEWFNAAIGAVFGADIMNGYPDGSFKPGDFIKRGEAIVAVDKGHTYFAAITPTLPAIVEPTPPAVSTGGGHHHVADTTNPYLTAVAHNEGEHTITLTYSEPIQFTTEHGDIVTPVSPAILNIFVATYNEGTDDWDYDLSTTAPGVVITNTSFNDTATILTVTYSGNLVNGANYVVDSWVADSSPGAGDGGYDIKDLAGNVDVTGVSPAFTADTVGPHLTAVAHNETAKTITLTYSEPVHFETEHGNVITPVSPAILNIFVSTLGGDYNLESIAPDITITAAAFNVANTILTVTYTGNLEKMVNTSYVVDSWVADTTPGAGDGGYDIKDASGNVDVEGVSPVFTVNAVGPHLAAVAHDETTKTITLTYSEPIHFETEHGNVVTPVSPAILNIFVATYNEGTDDWDYSLATTAPGVAITGAVFTSGDAILTVTYTGNLEKMVNTSYVVDSWVSDTSPGAGDGGYDIKDAAGNVDVTGVSPAFTVNAVGPHLTAVAHDETAKTITLTYSEPIHFETEHGNVITPVSPAILNIFVATWNGTTHDWDYSLSTTAPGVAITSAAFNVTNTVLTVTYTGSLVPSTNYVVDSWVADTTPGAGDGGYDIKDAAGNVDIAGVSPAFSITLD